MPSRILLALLLLDLCLLHSEITAKRCPNHCFIRFRKARSQCRKLPDCRVRRCRGLRTRWKCTTPLRLPSVSQPVGIPSPAVCSIRVLLRNDTFALGCVCAKDAESVVLRFKLRPKDDSSCVGDCAAQRIVTAGVCGTGSSPKPRDVEKVVRNGYEICCQACGGEFDQKVNVCQLVY